MADPYRDPVFRCPACADASLREYEGRLLCDACNGIFVGRADLEKAVEELGGLAVELQFEKDAPGSRACPRCTRAMTTCRLRLVFAVIDKHPKTAPRLDRCDADGIWFDHLELVEVFTAANRVTGGGGGGGRGGAGSAGGPGGVRVPGNGFGWGFGA